MNILVDADALARTGADDIVALTEAATAATFHAPALTPEQVAANRRIPAISAATCRAAAAAPHQHLAAAFVGDELAGYVIATRHAPDDRELDWLIVDPRFHGTSVSSALMRSGIEWLGSDASIWLNVIRHNERAIRFYRKFGFAIDTDARTDHVIPHVIMRRAPDADESAIRQLPAPPLPPCGK